MQLPLLVKVEADSLITVLTYARIAHYGIYLIDMKSLIHWNSAPSRRREAVIVPLVLLRVDLAEGLAAGSYTLKAIITPLTGITESDTDNNDVTNDRLGDPVALLVV